jgi:hypothetical protein
MGLILLDDQDEDAFHPDPGENFARSTADKAQTLARTDNTQHRWPQH